MIDTITNKVKAFYTNDQRSFGTKFLITGFAVMFAWLLIWGLL